MHHVKIKDQNIQQSFAKRKDGSRNEVPFSSITWQILIYCSSVLSCPIVQGSVLPEVIFQSLKINMLVLNHYLDIAHTEEGSKKVTRKKAVNIPQMHL